MVEGAAKDRLKVDWDRLLKKSGPAIGGGPLEKWTLIWCKVEKKKPVDDRPVMVTDGEVVTLGVWQSGGWITMTEMNDVQGWYYLPQAGMDFEGYVK